MQRLAAPPAYSLLQAGEMKFGGLASLVVLLLARSVQAADPPSVSGADSAPPQRREWYGWQTVLVDVASLGLGATLTGLRGSGSSGRDVGNIAGVLTVTTFALGGPVVHAAHAQWEKAGASLGLRLGAPIAGALGGFLVGAASCPHDQRDVPCAAIGAGFGLFAGAATAIIVDAAVIAYKPEPKAALGVRFAPLIIADRDRLGAGFGGIF